MKKTYLILVINCVFYSLIISQNTDSRTVINKDNNFFYYKCLEIDNTDLLLFPYCTGAYQWCDELLIDQISPTGQIKNAFKLPVSDYTRIVYLSNSPVEEDNISGKYHFLLRATRNDSLFILDTEVDLVNQKVEISEQYFVTTDIKAVFLTDAKKTANGYLIAGYTTDSAAADDYIFIEYNEQGSITNYTSIERSESEFPILFTLHDIEILNDDRYLLIGTGGASYVVNKNYKFISFVGFVESTPPPANDIIFVGTGSCASIKDEHTFIISGEGSTGTDFTSSNQLLAQYHFENDTVSFDKVISIENLIGADIEVNFFDSMKKDINNDYILGGFENLSGTPGFGGPPNHIYVAKYSQDLEKVWYNRYGGDFYHQSYNMNTLSNGNIIIYGSVDDYFGEDKRQGFYLLLDNQGEVLTSTHPIYEIEDLAVYPNPVSTEINIKNRNENYDRYEIFDSYRKLIKSNKLNAQSIDVSNFQDGAYILKLYSSDGKIHIAKFIKQR